MKLAKILLMLTFFSYPYYLFPSGGFQPASGVLMIAFTALLFMAPKLVRFSLAMIILILYTMYAAGINLYWYFSTGDDTFLTHLIITAFGSFMFVVMGNIFNQFNRKDAKVFLFVIAFTLTTQLALLLLGLVKDVGGGRQIIWFNNPNQLGYFCVIASTLAVIVSYYYKIKTLTVPLVIALSVVLTAFTLSRASLGALVLFIPILLFLSTTLTLGKKIVVVVFLAICGIFVTDIYLKSETYAALERRVERSQARETESTAEVRHYDRIWLYPDNLAFGAGKGGYDRFEGKPQEIHNLFLSVLFSFGAVGFLIYLYFWHKIIPNLQVFIFMIPVLVYNMTHNGGRVIVFWMLLAMIASAAGNKSKRSPVRRKAIK